MQVGDFVVVNSDKTYLPGAWGIVTDTWVEKKTVYFQVHFKGGLRHSGGSAVDWVATFTDNGAIRPASMVERKLMQACFDREVLK